MKKIFYLIFFAILFFSINISINAASGYCEYSLTRFSEGNGIFTFDKSTDVTVRFKVDTSKKNKVDVEWISDFETLKKNQQSYQVYDNSGNLVNYKLGFDANNLYNKIISGNEFSCPNLYGLYTAERFYLELYYDSRVDSTASFVQLNFVGSEKPNNMSEEQLINECGIGNIDKDYGIPENTTITFKKYNNRNEVCINYYRGSSICEDYISGADMVISTEIKSTKKTFMFESDDLDKVFNNSSCVNFWIDNSRSSDGVFIVTTQKPDSGQDSEMTTEDFEEAQQNQQFIDGTRFKDLLGQLKAPLSNLYSEALNFQLTIDGNPNATLNDITTSDELCKDDNNDCSENARYLTERGLKNVREYCNEIYSQYSKYKNDSDMINRMDECNSFDDFYDRLISEGMVEDLADGCGIITAELAEKLNYFLDIIKIAGPLIALGLGTVDFIKVIANGDADKEMKNAFKKFMIRLGAAALLFIIPIIIAFLLDIFMKPNSGYESDNPFCNVIDWDE